MATCTQRASFGLATGKVVRPPRAASPLVTTVKPPSGPVNEAEISTARAEIPGLDDSWAVLLSTETVLSRYTAGSSTTSLWGNPAF